MPNIKSAIKRTKVIAKKTAVNKMQKSKIRTMLKKAGQAAAASADQAGDIVRQTQSALDKAAAQGYLHKNNVARKKSRLARMMAGKS